MVSIAGIVKANLKILVLIAIIAAGIAAQKLDLLNLNHALVEIENISDFWWLPIAMVLAQVIFYLAALPGSVFMWTIGVIYPPFTATILFAAGGVAGSLAAYFLSAEISTVWTRNLSRSRIFKSLQENSGFLQLLALRCLPGFPHSIINYSAGILKLRMPGFITSTVIGFTVKGYIYCSAIYTAFHFEDVARPLSSIRTLFPLLALVIFSLAGVIIRKKYVNQKP